MAALVILDVLVFEWTAQIAPAVLLPGLTSTVADAHFAVGFVSVAGSAEKLALGNLCEELDVWHRPCSAENVEGFGARVNVINLKIVLVAASDAVTA